MSQQFKEQGGAATMDPSPARRWLTSKMMTSLSSKNRQLRKRKKAESKRVKLGEPHTVEYFHQVDDGYSHLAAQVLQRFSDRYQVELKCHIVGGPEGDNAPENELLLRLSRYDSSKVAPYYGLAFAEHDASLDPALSQQAASILAALSDEQFTAKAAEIGEAMWASQATKLDELAKSLGSISASDTAAAIAKGNARRSELQHYSGAMLYYGGEWYWGVDRLYHLEQRLAELGLDSTPGEPLLVSRPLLDTGPLKDEGRLTLEIYPSLRSPYTAVAFDQTVAFAAAVGVNLKLRPVLPMVMRGVPATREKGAYILFDAGREARAAGVQFGPCADPIGEPARRAYSLFSWAERQGKSVEFFSSFLRCAWIDEVNTNNDRGMQQVVENAGLDWSQAKKIIGQAGWESALEANRLAMYEMGLWGVPSYRLLNEKGESVLELWGQDRLWVVAKEIQNQLRVRA